MLNLIYKVFYVNIFNKLFTFLDVLLKYCKFLL